MKEHMTHWKLYWLQNVISIIYAFELSSSYFGKRQFAFWKDIINLLSILHFFLIFYVKLILV